jgi:hypothetical protein
VGGVFGYNVYQKSQDEKRLEKMREDYKQSQEEVDMLKDYYDALCEEQPDEC